MTHKGKPIDPEQRYLSPRQAARLMGCSEYLIFKSYHSKLIPGARELGGRIFIPRNWVEN
jgi:site-specific DNA-cytosine methylase